MFLDAHKLAAQRATQGIYVPEAFSFVQPRLDESVTDLESFLSFQCRLFDFEVEKSRFASNLSRSGHTVYCDRTSYSPLLFTAAKLLLDKRSPEQTDHALEHFETHIHQTTELMLPKNLEVIEVHAEEQKSRARLDPERNTDALLFDNIFHNHYRFMRETIVSAD